MSVTTQHQIGYKTNDKPGEIELSEKIEEGGKHDPPATDHELLKSRWDELPLLKSVYIFRKAVLVSVLVYTGYVCEGFELSVGNNILANKGFIAQFASRGGEDGVRKLDPTWLSLWGVMLNIGQIITFSYIHWFADRFGRKASFYLSWLWLLAGCAFLNFAKTSPVWALGKLCNGAGIGILQVVCQVYVMEVMPNRIRGGMFAFQWVWNNLGQLITSTMLQQINKRYPMNYLLAVRMIWIPAGLMILCYAFIPESPWYYTRRGNKAAALKSLNSLYGKVPGYDIEEEYGIVERTIRHEIDANNNKSTILDIFRGGNLASTRSARRTLTVIMLANVGSFAGLAVLNTYSTYFFSLAGLKDPFLGSLILACCNIIAIVSWLLTVDKIGRRNILVGAQLVVTTSLILCGSLYFTGASKGNASAATGLLVVCSFWTASWTIVSKAYYIYSAELPSAVLRVKTGPVTFFTSSCISIAWGFATPPMLLALNLKAGFVFGAFSVPFCFLVWFFVPETKGRSAAEIDELYASKVPEYRWHKTTTKVEEAMRAVVNDRPLEA